VISFTLQPFYLWEKSPQYPLDTRLGGRQSRSGCGDVGKKSPINVPPPPPGSEPQSVCKNVWQKTQDEVPRAPGGGGAGATRTVESLLIGKKLLTYLVPGSGKDRLPWFTVWTGRVTVTGVLSSPPPLPGEEPWTQPRPYPNGITPGEQTAEAWSCPLYYNSTV